MGKRDIQAEEVALRLYSAAALIRLSVLTEKHAPMFHDKRLDESQGKDGGVLKPISEDDESAMITVRARVSNCEDSLKDFRGRTNGSVPFGHWRWGARMPNEGPMVKIALGMEWLIMKKTQQNLKKEHSKKGSTTHIEEGRSSVQAFAHGMEMLLSTSAQQQTVRDHQITSALEAGALTLHESSTIALEVVIDSLCLDSPVLSSFAGLRLVNLYMQERFAAHRTTFITMLFCCIGQHDSSDIRACAADSLLHYMRVKKSTRMSLRLSQLSAQRPPPANKQNERFNDEINAEITRPHNLLRAAFAISSDKHCESDEPFFHLVQLMCEALLSNFDHKVASRQHGDNIGIAYSSTELDFHLAVLDNLGHFWCNMSTNDTPSIVFQAASIFATLETDTNQRTIAKPRLSFTGACKMVMNSRRLTLRQLPTYRRATAIMTQIKTVQDRAHRQRKMLINDEDSAVVAGVQKCEVDMLSALIANDPERIFVLIEDATECYPWCHCIGDWLSEVVEHAEHDRIPGWEQYKETLEQLFIVIRDRRLIDTFGTEDD
jgi:hypothetical protein